MSFNKGNCIIGQSGGPTVAINASLSGILSEILHSKLYNIAFGMINGIEGLIQSKYITLTDFFRTQESLDMLTITPSMFLGSCRYKLPDANQNPQVYEDLFDFFKLNNIVTVFYIGGNDSMDTVLKLSDYAKKTNQNVNVIGIPKTIDNDLPITDHTPGFGSAAKYVATSLLEIAHDSYIYNIPSITLVEIMGRNAGWLTAASALARTNYSKAPHLIYLPEIPFNINKFLEDINRVRKTTKNIIIALSEGLKDEDGNYLAAKESYVDSFGHTQLCGTGKYLENIVAKNIGCKVRSVEINVLQRSAAHCSSKTDLNESVLLGKAAAKLGASNVTGQMVCYERKGNTPYEIEITSYDILKIANQEKRVPLEWISKDQCDVTSQMLDYLRPLIQGEPAVTYANGIPVYSDISHLCQRKYYQL